MAHPRPDQTADARFRRAHRRRVVTGLTVSLALHVVLLFGLPVIPASHQRTPAPELEVVSLPGGVSEPPPRVVVPEPVVPVPTPSPPSPDVRDEEPGEIPPPRLTPHDVPPRLLNRRQVERTLSDLYPGELEIMRVGGVVTLWLYIDTEGRVVRTVLREPSRFEAFNRAAEAVAQSMQFSPARQAGDTIPVWVQQRIRFQSQDTTSGPAGDETGSEGDA